MFTILFLFSYGNMMRNKIAWPALLIFDILEAFRGRLLRKPVEVLL